MKAKAAGTFEVKITPQNTGEKLGAAGVSRFALDKQYEGDLEAVSQGQMVAAGTEVKGSAGYVAIEKVTGTLGNRTGTFFLQHSGIMSRGESSLNVVVIPDSGTADLAGLSGTLTIKIEGGKHFYEFEYLVAEKPE